MLFKSKELNFISYIFIDSIDNIKRSELETWYKTLVKTNTGIWLGNGIMDQYSLKTNQKIEEMKRNISDDYCFVIKNGIPECVKFVSQI